MSGRYDSFENGTFCIDIEHARRAGVASALMITQFKQGEDRVFCRAFPSGCGYSREMENLLPMCDADAMTIFFAAYRPSEKITSDVKLVTIDDLIAQHTAKNLPRWKPSKEGGAK